MPKGAEITKLKNHNDPPCLTQILPALRQIGRTVSSSSDLEQTCYKVYELIKALIPTAAFYIGMDSDAGKSLKWVFTVKAGEGKQLRKVKKFAENGILTPLLAIHEPSIISDPRQGQSFWEALWDSKSNGKVSGPVILVPIVLQNKTKGLLALVKNGQQESLTETEIELLSIVATQVGMAAEFLKLRNQMRTQCFEKEQLKSILELTNKIGHELNQPLTGISGYCALIKEELSEDDGIYEDIKEIEQQARRLESLIVKFQNLAHIDRSPTSSD